MKNRYLPLVLAASLLLLIGSVAAGCSSDENTDTPDPAPTSSGTPLPPEIDDYLEDIEEIFADITDEIGQIEATFERRFASADDAEDADEALDDAIRDYQRVIDRASLDVNSLRQAAEAAIQHDALAAALDRAATSIDALQEEYREIRGDNDAPDVHPAQTALAALAAEAFALISTELEDACLELQDLAVEHEVEVDIECADEEPAPTGQPTPDGSPAPTDDPA